MDQFSRCALLLGEDGLRRMTAARVTVLGLGAVGYTVAEGLVRSGLGAIRIMDFDDVHASNLNRQLLALHSSVGQPKLKLAEARLLDINPDLKLHVLPAFLDQNTIPQVLDDSGIFVDAIDSFGPKAHFLLSAHRAGSRLISCMGAARRFDPGQVQRGDLWEVKGCPLAARLRSFLRRNGLNGGIRVVYSSELPQKALGDPEHDRYQRGRPRRPVGSLMHITLAFAAHLIAELIDQICDRESLRS